MTFFREKNKSRFVYKVPYKGVIAYVDIVYCLVLIQMTILHGSFSGVWLICPLADCPPEGSTQLDEPPYILST